MAIEQYSATLLETDRQRVLESMVRRTSKKSTIKKLNELKLFVIPNKDHHIVDGDIKWVKSLDIGGSNE